MTSIRDNPVLWLNARKAGGGGATALGGNTLLKTPQHKLDGPEHLTPDDTTTLDSTVTEHGLLPKLSGSATDALLGDGTWGPLASSVTLPWSYAQADGGLAGDGVTDDSAAFNSWITSVTASGTQSGWFFFEPGVYLIAGALQDTGAFNAQILLPTVGTGSKQITLTFMGVAQPPIEWNGPSAPGVGSGYSIIKSTLTGASGTACCIGGGNNGSGTGNINNIRPVFENLIFIGPDNPTFTMLNLGQCQGADLRGVQIATPGGYSGSLTQPTHSNAYGVKMPERYMANEALTDALSIGEWYTCIRFGELDQHHGLVLGNCIVAAEAPASFYPTVVETMQLTGFTYGIKVTAFHPIHIANYVAEHSTSPSWRVTVYDLDDASNFGVGDIDWFNAATGGTADHSFVKNGGTGINTRELGTAPATLTVKDEGTPLATAATSLDFVGAGVVASGTGAAKTITIAGSSVATLDDLTDVTLTSPATADRLRYDGSVWRNSALIWRPMTTYDPTTGLWVPLVDGDGNAIMAEA